MLKCTVAKPGAQVERSAANLLKSKLENSNVLILEEGGKSQEHL